MSSHQSGRLKQSNKGHRKIGHSSKRSVDRKLAKGGRVVGNTTKNKSRKKFPNKDIEGAGRANRLNRARQIAAERRKTMVLKRRFGAGAGNGSPKILTIVGLNHNADDLAYQIRTYVLGTSDRTPHDARGSPGCATTMVSERFRQRFTLLTPPSNDITAVLDAAKVCDVLVVVVEASVDASTFTNNTGIDTLCCLRAQGLPNVVGVQLDVASIPAKQRATAKKLGLRFFESELGANSKVVDVDRTQVSRSSVLLSRVLSETTGKDLTFRRHRSYLLADTCAFRPSTLDDGTVVHNTTAKDLHVSGYVRGAPLHVNALVHLTGIGTYRLRRLAHAQDPSPLKKARSTGGGGGGGGGGNNGGGGGNNGGVLAVADLSQQDTLVQTAEPDQLMGEQSFISDAELREADMRYNPETGGKLEEMSIHQAWIQAAKEAMVEEMAKGGDDRMLYDDEEDEEEEDCVLGALDGRGQPIGEAATLLMKGKVNEKRGQKREAWSKGRGQGVKGRDRY